LDKVLGRKAGLVEDAFERAAFKVFAMEGNSNEAGAVGVPKKPM
jgi:hypothetical protein